jgi:hypothetical protein
MDEIQVREWPPNNDPRSLYKDIRIPNGGLVEVRFNYRYQPDREPTLMSRSYPVLQGSHWIEYTPPTPQQIAEQSLGDFFRDRGANIISTGSGNWSDLRYDYQGKRCDDGSYHGSYFSLVIKRSDLGKISDLLSLPRQFNKTGYSNTLSPA